MANDELKNLPPEERVKKLKELEKEKKKEIEEAQKHIKESEDEITDRQNFKDKVPMPEFAQDDLKGLSKEAKEILKEQKGLKEKKEDENLEEGEEEGEEKEESIEDLLKKKPGVDLESLAREKMDLPPEIINSDYTQQLSQKPMHNIYDEMKNINAAVEEKGYISQEEERRVEYLTSAVEKKLEAEESGSYSFTEDVAMSANITQQLGAKLMNVYRSEAKNWYQ